MGRPHLKVYLDVVSPYAYLAFHITKHSPVFKGCDVEYVPIFLGGVMQAAGNQAPIGIKNKGEYIQKERVKYAKYFGVPMSPDSPKPFPQMTVQAMRAITAVTLLCPDKLDDVFAEMYRVFWTELKPISKPEVFGACLVTALGEAEAKKVMEKSTTPEIKKLLTERTNEAFKEGAFGLPWFMATNAKGETEGFWGISHLGMVVEHLGLDRKQDQGFRALL